MIIHRTIHCVVEIGHSQTPRKKPLTAHNIDTHTNASQAVQCIHELKLLLALVKVTVLQIIIDELQSVQERERVRWIFRT